MVFYLGSSKSRIQHCALVGECHVAHQQAVAVLQLLQLQSYLTTPPWELLQQPEGSNSRLSHR